MSSQLYFAVAMQLEGSLGETSNSDDFQFAHFEFSDVGIHVGEEDMEAKLFAYVAASVHESRKHRVMCLASDKASPCSGSLQNATITYPNNVAVVCCPQVVWGYAAS